MSDIASLLPPSSTEATHKVEQTLAEKHDVLAAPIGEFWNAINCPANLLPWLAWAHSIDVWDSNWSEETKREAINQSFEVHKQKGTLASIKWALSAAGYGDAEVIERYGWEFYNGAATHDGSASHDEPDHWAEYRVRLARPITIEQADQVRAILATVAPARCHLKALDFTQAFNAYTARINHDGQFTHGVV